MPKKDYDVLVAGAGVAGVAAALECARSGMKTALVEKTILPGGLATSGLICIYLPLCDGFGRQVTFGLAEELLHLSLKYGPGEIPAGWSGPHEKNVPDRLGAPFSPASFILALDEALIAAGVEIRLDTLVCDAVVKRGRLTGLEVEDKGGRRTLSAKCVIDATGDADVASRAGAACAKGGNWLAAWALGASLESARNAVRRKKGDALLDLAILGAGSTGEGHPHGMKKFDGTDPADVTRFVLEGRKLLREHYRRRQAEAGRSSVFPLTVPAMAQLRTTRRIVGEATLTDGRHGCRFADSVGLVSDWRKAGYVWEVPFGTLVPKGVKGMLAAGRCISSAGDAWEVTRVIPAAASTGQAAGAAATLAVKHGTTPDRLDVRDVQRRLSRHGVLLHLDEIGR
jgi:hypothetical protein